MIDSITTEDLKMAMRQYRKGGSIMPSDVQADLDEFQEELKRTDLSDDDRMSFESAVKNIESKYPTSEDLDEIDFEDRSIQYLTNGNWSDNPRDMFRNTGLQWYSDPTFYCCGW